MERGKQTPPNVVSALLLYAAAALGEVVELQSQHQPPSPRHRRSSSPRPSGSEEKFSRSLSPLGYSNSFRAFVVARRRKRLLLMPKMKLLSLCFGILFVTLMSRVGGGGGGSRGRFACGGLRQTIKPWNNHNVISRFRFQTPTRERMWVGV
jgi:hypothetical protein